MSARRLAALDLGTNSARLAVAEISDRGELRFVVDERIPCRLGEDLASTGRLRPEAEARAAEALRQLTARARASRAERLEIVATYALRAATNGPEFLERVQRDLGIRVRVLTGEEEARLVLRAARRYAAPDQSPLVSLDLGGGSLELSREDGEKPRRLVSLPLGAVVMRDVIPEKAPPAALEALGQQVRRLLEEHAADFAGCTSEPMAAGGTVTSAARLLGVRGPLSGVAIAARDLENQLVRLAGLDLETRRRLPGLATDRADIIVPGLAVLCETLRFLAARGLRVHEHGVREGVLLAMQAGDL